MSEPRLIRDYLAVLSARLPGSITEELAGGLTETYQAYLRRGQAPDAAARSAVAEFGDPYLVTAEFTRVNPARHASRYVCVVPGQRRIRRVRPAGAGVHG